MLALVKSGILYLTSTSVSSTHEFLLSLSEIGPTDTFPQKHASSPQSHIYILSNQVPITVIVTPAATHKGPATQVMLAHIYTLPTDTHAHHPRSHTKGKPHTNTQCFTSAAHAHARTQSQPPGEGLLTGSCSSGGHPGAGSSSAPCTRPLAAACPPRCRCV